MFFCFTKSQGGFHSISNLHLFAVGTRPWRRLLVGIRVGMELVQFTRCILGIKQRRIDGRERLLVRVAQI